MNETAALYEALAARTEELCAQLRQGDVTRVEQFSAWRDQVLARIDELNTARGSQPGEAAARLGEADDAERCRHRSAAAIRRILALEPELVRILEHHKATVRRELDLLRESRHSLESYRTEAGSDPRFFDQLA